MSNQSQNFSGKIHRKTPYLVVQTLASFGISESSQPKPPVDHGMCQAKMQVSPAKTLYNTTKW